MSKTLENISFVDLLPGSIAEDETIKAAANSLDEELQNINSGINEILIYSRIEELENADLLSHLAWAFKTPFWDESLSLEKKRQLIKQSIAWHKRRGTPSAVEDVITTVLGTGLLLEWWEYEGAPYHFKVSTEGVLEEDDYSTFFEVVDSVKNKRSVLDSVMTKKNKEIDLTAGVGIYKFSQRSMVING